jgi:hypothetical protein
VTDPRVTSILLKVDQLLDQLLSKKPEPTEEPEPSAGTDRVQQVRDQMQEIRKLLQRTAAAFGAAATLLLAGLGYAQLHQIFPLPVHDRVWTALAAAIGAAFAVVGAVLLSGAFFRAQRRILITPADKDEDFGKPDQKIKDDLYGRVAVEENAPSVDALELRARRLERMALATTDPDARDELEKEAARLTGAYRWVMILTSLHVLERRSQAAYRHSPIWALVAALGIALMFGAADYSKGERDKIALFTSCQQAIKLGANEACDSLREPATPDEKRAKAAKQRNERKAQKAAVAKARAILKDASKPLVTRLQACARVLGTTSEFAGAPTAAVLNACIRLTFHS